MSWKNDNFWKQVESFKGRGQNNQVSRWGAQKILLLILVALIVGVLLATALESFF